MLMKRYILFFLLLIGTTLIASSQITVSPALPTDAEQVVITLNAAGTGLNNYTGDVYAHTGVTIGSAKWQYVKGAWGNNTTQPKLTRTGTNTYTLTIAPSIRQYYGVPAGTTIAQLDFVFRSSDALKQTSPDIFYTVYAQGLTVDITNPTQDKPIYELNSVIPVQVSANGSTSLKLYVDNAEAISVTATSISYNYTANTYGKHWFKAIATSATETKKDSVYILVRPAVTTEALPAGVAPGVNIIDNQTVTFVLNDPPALKQYCYLIGSFSNWLVDDQYYMKRTPDGKYYWITLTNLDQNTEYLYQYFIDGQLKLADPYTTKTSDSNDQYISSTNYPNLIAYPKDKTSGIASAFKINEVQYIWKISNFTPPVKKDLVIYELHIRDFISGDYIKTVMDSLNYLQKLGVNAIELMPISEFEGNDSWGYNPSFYFAPDKAYGTKNDYKAFIDSCHSKGIAVIQDIVFNHSYGQSPMVQMYYNSTLNRPSADNPWYNQTSPNTSYSWGNDFNHASVYTKAFVDQVLTYWLTEYKIDGFRFDFSKGFTNTPGDGSAYDASRIAILEQYANTIWTTKPNGYLILEHFCANAEEKELSEYYNGIMIWGNMNFAYNQATMSYNDAGGSWDFSGVSYKNRGWTVPNLVGYMESHDEERLMFKNKAYGNSTNTSYNIKSIPVGLTRNELAGVFFFTVPGPKMMWQFGELGYDISINLNNDRVGRKPIHWEYYYDNNRRHLLSVYTQLINMKKTYPVFGTSDYTTSFSGAVKWIKLNHVDMNAVAIGNFDVQTQSTTFNFPNTGRWYEYFSQDSIDLASTAVNFSFAPGEYRLYTTQRIVKKDIFNGVDNHQEFTSNSAIEVWPNPNYGSFTLSFTLQNSSKAFVSIYSITGQNILNREVTGLPSGSNSLEIQLPSYISTGLYFCKITAGSKILTTKILIR
jgi:glycosidase